MRTCSRTYSCKSKKKCLAWARQSRPLLEPQQLQPSLLSLQQKHQSDWWCPCHVECPFASLWVQKKLDTQQCRIWIDDDGKGYGECAKRIKRNTPQVLLESDGVTYIWRHAFSPRDMELTRAEPRNRRLRKARGMNDYLAFRLMIFQVRNEERITPTSLSISRWIALSSRTLKHEGAKGTIFPLGHNV